VEAKTKAILQESDNISVTLDMWSNRQMKGFLGITGHFIHDWSMQSVMLGCQRFRGQHSADNISNAYDEVTASYDLTGKVSNVITDNASNMLKAFRLPGFNTEPDSDEEDESEAVDLNHNLPLLTEHDPCFAHSLQLVVKDGFKDAASLNKVLSKAANIVSHVRRSIHATEILEGEKRLQAKVATRWNSELKSVRSLLSVTEKKLQLVPACPQLSAYERNILEELVAILTPFEEAIEFTQGQNSVTASFVIPCIRGLRASLASTPVRYNTKLVSALKLSLLDRRLSAYESRQLFNSASILDPRFKMDWCSGLEAETAKSSFIDMARHAPSTTQETAPAVNPTAPPQPKRSKLFSFMASPQAPVPTSDSDHIIEELGSYLSEPCAPENADPLEFWRSNAAKYPALARLAKRYLGIPASSTPVERLFSIAGKIFRPDRCSLSDAVFHSLMAVKCNGHL